VAGVIGKKRFVYDSDNTYQRVKDLFVCEPRGKVSVKHKGEVEMCFVERIKPEYSENGEGLIPNAAFEQACQELQSLVPGDQ